MSGNRHGLKRILMTGCLLAVLTLSAQLFAAKGGNGGGGMPGDGGGGSGENVNYAFVHNVSQKGLFLTTIDGANTFELTKPDGKFDYDRSPSWSHDLDPQTDGYQSQIAYLRYLDNDDLTYLYVINPDGSGNQLVRAFGPNEPRPEDHNSRETVLVWSPNGQEILFSDNDLSDAATDQDSGIYAVEVATGNVRTIMGRELVNGFWYGPARPSISPLGRLAFEFLSDIYAVEFLLDENGLIQVDPQAAWFNVSSPFSQNLGEIDLPVWSPDGTYLAFTSFDESVEPEVSTIVIYDALLDEIVASIPFVNHFQHVTWSPDGAEIGLVDSRVNARGKVITDVYRITDWKDPNLRQFVRVTQTDRDEEFAPHWNPGWGQP